MEARKRNLDVYPYQEFMAREDIPVYQAIIGVEDVTALPRSPWRRAGGNGTFVELRGTFQAERGIYIADIPGSSQLNAEKHLYEEAVFVLQGHGLAEVWQGQGRKLTFEWQEGSVFAFPRNVWHRLYNGSREPAVFMGVTTAPRVMNTFYDLDYTFSSDYEFVDLYADGGTYFSDPGLRTTEHSYSVGVLHTNFIADARQIALDAQERKVAGGQLTLYRMGTKFPNGHISEWPAGRYHKAHHHGPGAILLGLDGEGYVLAWDSRLGPHPYQDGYGDQVHKVGWRKNSIYTPPNAYFHQHFNSGAGPARHVAIYGSPPTPLTHPPDNELGWTGFQSFREGGTLIEYEDEDPQVRREFEQALAAKGIAVAMPVLR